MKKRGLGKGLDALIGPDLEEIEKQLHESNREGDASDNPVMMVDIYQVEPDREQPRKDFDEEKLEELAESIRQYGVLQPLLVQKKDEYYKIIAGERRWRAAKLAGVHEVPIIIKDYTQEETLEISLIENIQRQDLNPIEEARAYERLLREYHLTQEEIAQRVGKSRSAIANCLRYLNLQEQVQSMMMEGVLSAGHAKVLLGIEDRELQYTLALRVMDEDLSVRQLEKVLQQMKKSQPQAAPPASANPIYHSVEERMKEVLGTKVIVTQGKKKGKIEIEYYSDEDLDRLLTLFDSIKQF